MKKDHTILIICVLTGALISSTLAYLFLTDKGKNIIRDKAAEAISKKTKIPKKIVRKAAKRAG